MVKIKVCGITNIKDALECVELGIDALGFIFAESKRRVNKETVKEIARELPPFITLVGVFVNEEKETVKKIAKYCKLDILQFHGQETTNYCQEFIEYKTIKSFSIKSKFSLEDVNNFQVSAYLFDTFKMGTHGGTGICFDWNVLKRASFKRPIIISGGLNSDNIARCINLLQPYAVDICSGVEEYPGKKDKEKLRNFIKKIKLIEL
ncbi:MAG: phosphoribosylanthranilate isomerase [bacterium]|nr:phosphoribosylanthranilate isomerase [bacterium]